MKRIQAPEGVAALMRELYGDFKSGKSSGKNNLFLVNLPPPTEIEKNEIEKRKQQRRNNDNSAQSTAANNDVMNTPVLKTVSYRYIFLNADPYKVNDALGCVEVEIMGHKTFYKTENAYDICKGLKLFAKGEKYDVDGDTLVDDVKRHNPKLTFKQARVFVHGIKGYLGCALDALGFLERVDRDSAMNQWLDQGIKCEFDIDPNDVAVKIISKIIENGQ